MCCQAADDSRDAAVNQDMERLKTAMTTKDYGTLIDLMYEPIVQAGGGKEAMLAQSKMVADMVTFTSFESTKPYTYYAGTERDYVVIPTNLVLAIGGHHYDSMSFELGVKPHGATKWEYVDGAGIKPPVRDQFFPDLPKDAVLPEVHRKPLD